MKAPMLTGHFKGSESEGVRRQLSEMNEQQGFSNLDT